jgi:photosystem II stability/assembly factor-like uncharacterized protein
MTPLITAVLLTVAVTSALAAQADPALYAGLKARSIGPAGMSGRIAAVDVVLSDRNTIYVGAATGGVWKSADRGTTWSPVFDSQATSSIGAVAVFQPAPDIVWVGTGEGNPRNSAGVGNGVYKSLDGGTSWTHLGLAASERIHRIVLHPTDANVAYVAALGPTWSDGDERGVFKTSDGGKTWRRVLHVDQRTGAADLVMDPRNPNKLLAALWEHRREPWFFTSGGPGSGLYVTHDGGDTWKRLTAQDGLPRGNVGRIGVAIAASNSSVVYALVEATKSALLRSDDGGRAWRTVNDSSGIAPRPFYYADLRVDPTNENRVYNLHGQVTVSEDGGRSFRTLTGPSIHGDVHELWIHPNGRFMVLGDDGGIRISHDGGKHWRFVENLPLAQFYHISVDMDTPYHVYGGLQDNGSWMGPSAVWTAGAIRNSDWEAVGFGDGFATIRDFAAPRYVYSMWQGGLLGRYDRTTGELKDLQPQHPQGIRLRFNWNAGLNLDPFDSTTMYLGSQFLHRTRDHGLTWEIISPDLTSNNAEKQRSHESGGLTRDVSGAETHTTILTVAPSPVERGVIWVGTDDGNVQLTRDGGATWTNVGSRVRGVPEATWVPHIEPSKFAAGMAFVVFDDHRRGNWTTYVYRTTDYGRTWESLATPTLRGFAHVIRQDLVVADLLFLGTEFGLYVTMDGGRSWFQWTHGLPTAPYTAFVVHPRDHDLVIGTHGRAAYVLDDIRPLQAIARDPTLLDRRLHLFEPPPAFQLAKPPDFFPNAPGYISAGDAMFAGENRPRGALLTYWVRQGDDTAKARIEIVNGNQVVRALEGPRKRGLNRTNWDLRRDAFKLPSVGFFTPSSGPRVPPGRYTTRIIVGADTALSSVDVLADPRMEIAESDRAAKYEALVRLGRRGEAIKEALDRITQVNNAIKLVQEALAERNDSTSVALRAGGTALGAKLDSLRAVFVQPPSLQGFLSAEAFALSGLLYAYFMMESSLEPPTAAQEVRVQRAERALAAALDRFNRVFAEDVAGYRRQVEASGFQLLSPQEPLKLETVR